MAKRQHGSHADEHEREAVDYVPDGGKSIVECAGDLGVNSKTPDDWVVKFKRRGEVTARRTDEQLEIDRLKRENMRLAKENEFLKKPVRQEVAPHDTARTACGPPSPRGDASRARAAGNGCARSPGDEAVPSQPAGGKHRQREAATGSESEPPAEGS